MFGLGSDQSPIFRDLDWTGLDCFGPVHLGRIGPNTQGITDTLSQQIDSYTYTHTCRLTLPFKSHNAHLTPHHLPLATHHWFGMVGCLEVVLASSGGLLHSDCSQRVVVMKWRCVWVFAVVYSYCIYSSLSMTGPYSLRLRASRLEGGAPTYYPLSSLTKARERRREKKDWPLWPACLTPEENFPTSLATRKSCTAMSDLSLENSSDTCARWHRPPFQSACCLCWAPTGP